MDLSRASQFQPLWTHSSYSDAVDWNTAPLACGSLHPSHTEQAFQPTEACLSNWVLWHRARTLLWLPSNGIFQASSLTIDPPETPRRPPL
ncbi:hypothetical protein DTO280E4_5790 [Paecilomyces variotii]|nr:hypothetical protein DTO021C3_5821 [Paecilomyces variotii]KAJ9307564.1 hypothetical protein DTO217A2_3036 [Paecilomyces variotii]KAJ9357225.1 hypothetical protein DTO280E4_5790 [Paecilomyces variotii]KAJ9382680.1 hypothetical protein DTO063F5_5519 [Paecilomyces variotii]